MPPRRPKPPPARPNRARAAPGPVPALPSFDERRASLTRSLGHDPDALRADIIERLTVYLEHLAHWTQRINLVGASTLPEAWSRHVLDSAALWPHVPVTTQRLADLGSGAGFPGLVLAILGAPDVHLVEADQRKAAFLREAARVTNTPVTVHAARLEALDPLGADVVTARALAPLPTLLPWVTRHLAPDGAALLLKGREAARELTACADQWIMRVDQRSRSEAPASAPSASAPGQDPDGCLLILREIRRVPSAS